MMPGVQMGLLVSLLLQSPPAAAPPVVKDAAATEALAPSANAEVFTRLLARLAAIPKRWDTIPAPMVPLSGRSRDDLLVQAPEIEKWKALLRMVRLASAPVTDRQALIEREIDGSSITEVDLWGPTTLVRMLEKSNPEFAAGTAEVLLQWAEALGRRDVLQFVVSDAIDILQPRVRPSALMPVVSSWAALAIPSGGEEGRALLLDSLATELLHLGDKHQALAAYRNARKLFMSVGDRLGPANATRGEAYALSLLGENESSLEAFRNARQLYPAVGDRLGQGNALRGEANVLLFLGEKQRALDGFRSARHIYLAAGDQLGEGYTWNGEADVPLHLGQPQEALTAYRNARQPFLALGNQLGQAHTWEGETDVLLILGENQSSLAAFRTARQLYAAAEERSGQGNSWKGEGDVLFRLGDYRQALAAYREARRLFVAIDDQLGQSNTWRGESHVLLALGEDRKALDAGESALRLSLAMGDQLGAANTLDDEADVFSRLGENQRALDAYQKARELFAHRGDQLGEANAWTGEAELLLHLGEEDRALEAFRTARRLFLAVRDRLGQGYTWRGEGKLLARLGRTREAADALRTARQLFTAVGDPIGQGDTWDDEADVLFLEGAGQEALDAYRKARQFFIATGSRLGQGNTWAGEARVLLRAGDWDGSERAAREAVASFENQDAYSNQIAALLVEALAEAQAGDPSTAAQSANRAIALHGQWRKTSATDRQRTDQEQPISAAYDLLVPLHARQPGHAAEALRLAEEARSRVLLDLLASAPPRGASASPADLATQRQGLRAETWEVEQQLRSAPSPSRANELRDRQRQLNRDLEWNDYLRIAAQADSLSSEPPLAAAAIQRLAGDAGPLLLYYAAPAELWGFLVLPAPAEILVRRIALPAEELGREVRDLAHDLANPLYEPRATAAARRLWDLLIAPFSSRIPEGGRLILVPHGPLHELPLEALLDPAGRRLFEHWATSVTPSASTLAFASRRHVAPTPDDAFVAFSAGRDLKLPPEEVAVISSFFTAGSPSLISSTALYSNYENLATQARHLLIATRGVHTEDSRRDTYLEIEPTPEVHDSRLSAAEIANIPLQAELVTLAACDTSHGRALLSDERLDLTRAFLIARAAAVLATRWKVPADTATSHFLIDFYRAYRRGGAHGQGLRKDEALSEARHLACERGDPAQVWAAWVLVGDAR